MAEQVIRITSVVGNSLCIASDDGERVHRAIAEVLLRGDSVRLSFEGAEDLTSAFLNAAVGQLYGEFPEDKLRTAMLPPVGASPDQLALLKRIVEGAKSFFRDPERHRQIVRQVLGDDDL